MSVLSYKLTKLDWLKDKIRLSLGYFFGEKYNTPSPFIKKKINTHFAKNIIEWDKMAVDSLDVQKGFNVLYAMQMQPEANIDVWGHPNSNQVELISRIIKNLNNSEKLIIKPNPKSKYEISDDLLTLVRENHKKVVLLKHSSKMNDIWMKTDVIVTVSGSVAIECVFDNKPVIVLAEALHAKQKNIYQLETNESMRHIIDQIKNKEFPMLSENEKVDYLQELMKTSYEGTNGDGLHNLHYINDNKNLDNLKGAFIDILNHV